MLMYYVSMSGKVMRIFYNEQDALDYMQYLHWKYPDYIVELTTREHIA